jgi:rhodanese-related sulfurtransferase
MKKQCIGLIFILFLLQTVTAFAETEPEGFKKITAPELKNMIDEGRQVTVIHVLSEIEYDMQHIEGSVNIPIVKMNTTDTLPKSKETILVFYCMGTR